MGFGTEEIGELIRQLKSEDYRDSEWCDNGKGFWAACDAYGSIRNEYNEYAGKHYRVEYFLKFALGKMGNLVLMVSCHVNRPGF